MPASINRRALELARDVQGGLQRTRRRMQRTVRDLRGGGRLADSGGLQPDKLVWIFGSARTGSTWLGAMMRDLPGQEWWHEPMVGYLFGHLYYERAGDRVGDDHFILGGGEKLWLDPVRRFVLDTATLRFPAVVANDEYLIVKEPHGSQGAPLLMRAFPESRMLFLIRDPRDVISSKMDLAKEGSVARRRLEQRGRQKKNTSADHRPDSFVKTQARRYLEHINLVKEVYAAHEGPKVVIRYEDLKADALETMRRIYRELRIPTADADIQKVVKKHAWENIPDWKKGTGQSRRKASPGGWTKDLTPEQSALVEEITGPIIREFYS